MIRSVTAAMLAAASLAAQAQPTCTQREFAQHLSDAKSGAGRISLAFAYCRNDQARQALRAGSPPAQVCDADLQKTLDALKQANQPKAVKFALGGCQGAFPQ